MSSELDLPVERIVSGGQTGVDRAALDVALAAGIPCGGWCPAGRRAEDGPISSRYPLRETAEFAYDVRTRRNIQDSDGTLIISTQPLTGGTALTRKLASEIGKPLLIIEPTGLFLSELIEQWLKDHKIRVLNVAGPRESTSPGIARQTRTILQQLWPAH
ncbi:putative molybdenum carrier protein [Rubinisphaera sp. JC750]|uniref:putative molybdenum carrier protein n=1 Tax=Rubinisphaera sp. JC750 TaxID=2898658 RepID=UPI001F34B466|nr:putative molybdenum carrier protein [Rubinisphaera sp. JC750]